VSAELVLEHRGNAAWPFDFRATQVLRLSDHSLEMQLSLTNLNDAPVPAGLGWHPYFVKRPDSRLAFAACGRWEMGPDQLPTALDSHSGLDLAVVQLAVDHCFEGWQGPLHWTNSSLRVSLESDLNRLVVFTRPELSCIAIEPVSHANNAFNRLALSDGDPHASGVRILAPEETFVATMKIMVQECG
jgi:aldose 1-epimerase